MAENNTGQKNENKKEQKHHSHDPLSRVRGGLILILLGILFLLASLDRIMWADWWAYFILGLGAILILEGLLRIMIPAYSEKVTGKLIGGTVLVVIGAFHLFGVVTWWPVILIVVGVVIVLSSFRRSGR